METWNGKRAGQVGACDIYGADEAFPIEEFSERLPTILEGVENIYYPLAHDSRFDKMILSALKKLQMKIRSGIDFPGQIINSDSILHEFRLIKSEEELQTLRHAAKISAKAHCRMMQMCRPGMKEYELEAECLAEFHRNGSHHTAYDSIVASGSNACILHYQENNATLKNGDLILIDAGCEYNYYAGDITRTFPINGKFSREQQAVYEIVLATQLECIQLARKGVEFQHGQNKAIAMLTQGLIDLKILTGELNELIETGAYRPFYMHRVSHWLGMDVHDVGRYKVNGQWQKLAPGMVLTVEPGLYFAEDTKVDEKWKGIGIRIEDDVIVTENEPEVISKDAPKTVADITLLMKS
jgi:Xaa-Pro aminopeptidase